jgi:hypothetical protein
MSCADGDWDVDDAADLRQIIGDSADTICTAGFDHYGGSSAPLVMNGVCYYRRYHNTECKWGGGQAHNRICKCVIPPTE